MLVFIDESGDPGMKEASSPYFTVTLVWFRDRDVANAVDRRIAFLREELKLPSSFEFHFSRIKSDFRKAFLRAVTPYDFSYMSMILNKKKLTGPGFAFPDSCYKWPLGKVFEDAKPYLENATVVIDGSGDRNFRRQLQTYLNRYTQDSAGNGMISKFKIQNSKNNNLIQLADMVCGAVARFYTDKKDQKNLGGLSRSVK